MIVAYRPQTFFREKSSLGAPCSCLGATISMNRVVLAIIFGSTALAQTPTIAAVANVANYGPALCPGIDVAIFGSNFGNGPASSVAIDVGGEPGFVTSVTSSQIEAQLPVNAPIGFTSLSVTVNGNTSAAFSLALAAYAPALFTQNNTGLGTGQFLTAANLPVTTASPAHPGDALYTYVLGLGATNPVTPTGASGTANLTAATPVLMVGNAAATILFSGTGGPVGKYQIRFEVPVGSTGVEPVTITIGGVTSTLPVTLPVAGATAPAIGSIDTPSDNITGITGAVSVTGWALSWAGVQTIALWREPITGEMPSANGLIFLTNSSIIPGIRPDVAVAYPGYPENNFGFGVQILTNELPDTAGGPGVGNGTWGIHVIVTDGSGEDTDLGTRTISANNAQGVAPFGTIDTPTTGGIASGNAFVNFGWVLTPNAANVVPKDGSTIWIYIDNVAVGHPIYDNYRPDIAALFPGLQNSNGAVGYYYIDTTKLTNGLHTISCAATDNEGNAQGLGSRFFLVVNEPI